MRLAQQSNPRKSRANTTVATKRKKAITSKTRLDEQGNAEVQNILQLATIEGMMPIVMAPCFNCPYNDQRCGSDPAKYDVNPADCDLFMDWVLWSGENTPRIDFLLKPS